MLAPAYETDGVQAFPISLNTAKGTFTDEPCTNRSVIHCIEDGDIIYTFTDNSTLQEALIAGSDRGITRDVKSITTTTEFLIG